MICDHANDNAAGHLVPCEVALLFGIHAKTCMVLHEYLLQTFFGNGY